MSRWIAAAPVLILWAVLAVMALLVLGGARPSVVVPLSPASFGITHLQARELAGSPGSFPRCQ